MTPTEEISHEGKRSWNTIPGVPTRTRNLSEEEVEILKSKDPKKLQIRGTYYVNSRKNNNPIIFWLPLNPYKIGQCKRTNKINF